MAEARSERLRPADALALAAWAGLAFGLAEGVLLTIARVFPTLRAPYKVSESILWAAPLVDIAAFLIVAAAVVALGLLLPRPIGQRGRRLLIGALVFLGVFATLDTLGVLYSWSVFLVAAGATAVALGKLRGREAGLTASLRRRAPLVPAALLGLFVLATSWTHGREARVVRSLPAFAEGAANVLFIVLDTVRRDSVEEERELTPTIQQLAARGTRYTNAWATSSWSLPSHATLLTGRHPHEHGADWPGLRLVPETSTLAEVLAAHGYVTGSFSGNANWVTPEYLGRGFARFRVYTFEQLFLRTTVGRAVSAGALKPLGVHPAGRGKRAPQLSRELLKFLEAHPDRPYFAYVTFMDVNQTFHRRRFAHRYWERPPSMAEVRDAYVDGLRRLDADVGRLLSELEARGALDNTVIVVASDHGESFGAEVGDRDPTGHGTSLYPEQTRVPLIVVHPPKVAAGAHVGATVSIRSVPATIAALLGFEESFGDGALPVMAAEPEPADGALMTLRYDDHNAQAVAWGGWQLIHTLAPDGPPVEELLDLGGRADHAVAAESLAASLRDRLARGLAGAQSTTSVESRIPANR